MSTTIKYTLVGAGSLVSSAIIGILCYAKGKKDGITIGMQKAGELPSGTTHDQSSRQQHAHA